MVKVVAIIPARSGSKGVRNKNIKLLAGRPLLAYSVAAACRTSNIQRVIVSTDSEHYANIAKEYGAEVPFLRPVKISDDRSTAYEFVKHALDWMREHEGLYPSLLILLLPTTPLRKVSIIETAIQRMLNDEDATGLRSVHEMSETAYKTVEIDNGYLKCICTGSFDIDAANLPRQGYPKTYQPNGYVDIIRSAWVMENGNLFGNQVIAHVTPPAAEVDSAEDFDYLEYQAERFPDIIRQLFEEGSG